MIPQRIKRAVLERQEGRCAVCNCDLATLAQACKKGFGKYLPRGRVAIEFDHVLPRAQGGTDDAGNIQALCGPCHHEKTEGERLDWERPSPSVFTETLRAQMRGPRPANKLLRLKGKAPQIKWAG